MPGAAHSHIGRPPSSLPPATPHRSEAELQDIRSFKEAAATMALREDRRSAHDPRLARFYMWAQTAATVFLACRVPTGACR